MNAYMRQVQFRYNEVGAIERGNNEHFTSWASFGFVNRRVSASLNGAYGLYK